MPRPAASPRRRRRSCWPRTSASGAPSPPPSSPTSSPSSPHPAASPSTATRSPPAAAPEALSTTDAGPARGAQNEPMTEDFATRIGALAGVAVADVREVGLRHGFRHLSGTLADGRAFFVKAAAGGGAPDGFADEARGLGWLGP